jgi:aminopeptidase N
VVANGRRVDELRWADDHVVIPARYLRFGPNRLSLRFTSAIAAAGASIIRYDEPEDGATYLYTLLVPADAHQLFPCFDQPDLKAAIRMRLTVPEGWTVLASAPLEERSPAPGGVTWRFAETRPISTYLAAFAAGPWASWEDAPRGERPIALYARRSQRPIVDAEEQIRTNREALRWLEEYFAVEYPFEKYDVLLAPAFPFGGMEHPGAVFYNKAPALIKQLEYLVGEEAFREGLRRFLVRHAYDNATWRDLLAALEETSGQSLAAFGDHYILRAGLPVVEPVLRLEAGRIAELRLEQRPARTLPEDPGGWWPGRVRVRLGYEGAEDVVLPVAFTAESTPVDAAAGLPAPDYVFANDGDYGYGIFLLDERSAEHLSDRVGDLEDDLLRAMIWGGLWDLVREARLSPERFVELVLRELPGEQDEQIAASLLGRSIGSLELYLTDTERTRLQAPLERMLLARMEDPALPYGLRKASLDALLEVARTPDGLDVLRGLLAEEREFDGQPLLQPSRWAAVETLLALDEPGAEALYRTEIRRDTTPEAARRAFTTGAAIPSVETKAEYFRRYLEDEELNEEWATASLSAFHHPEHEDLSLPYLRPALEQLRWIRENRRIFFLPSWIGAFVASHRTPEALRVVDEYLAEHPDLAPDLRRKVLQARDELERTVRVRRR